MKPGTDLEDIDVLLIDGDNLLHEVRGSRDEGGVAWLLPRLARWRPESMRIVVALDGHPAPAEAARRRVAKGIQFHHSGSRSADDLLVELLAAQPYAGRARTAVVTRDRGLRERIRRVGGLTRSIDWLLGSISRPGTGGAIAASARPVGIGQGKSPRPAAAAPPSPDLDERDAWRPGRGATRKKGNPRQTVKRTPRR